MNHTFIAHYYSATLLKIPPWMICLLELSKSLCRAKRGSKEQAEITFKARNSCAKLTIKSSRKVRLQQVLV
jgi:hypothetical protein